MFKLSEKCSLRLKLLRKVKIKACVTYSTRQNDVKSAGLDTAYQPSVVEANETGFGYFEPEITAEKPFSIILPPPNVTGVLHLGHALTATIQDVIVRWKRMQGVETLWVPGFDHAGIATQVILEKRLFKETGKTRHEIGREQFEKEVWKWKEEKCELIGSQLRRLGVSLDWSREMFTMDPGQSRAVSEAFIKLFDAGLIYRGDHLVNWSCVLQSAISDIEVEHLQVDGPTSVPVPGYDKSVHFGTLTHFAYKFHDSDEELVVATTRPETIVGDVAVAVHPHDNRYTPHIGRNLWHPFRRQTIPVICDDFVDPEFGTGAVKLTPAHDRDDFAVAKRHNLPLLQVIDEEGRMTSICGRFAGRKRFEARDMMLDELGRRRLLRGRQDHAMIIPICGRSKDVVEFLLRPQWFVKCGGMAERAVRQVKEGRLRIDPPHYEKIWFGYLENIRDWCISRQLWWGHRIPAYFCRSESGKGGWIAARDAEEASLKASSLFSVELDAIISVERDEDVLDTWFSSGLLPFSALGWPQQDHSDLDKHYPLSMMETGHDILFFWVARMVMLGTELTGKLPFEKILLHGIICDHQGRKMSKSLGNVIAPEHVISGSSLEELESESKASYDSGVLSADELECAIQGQKKMFPEGIPECGADALRFTLCSHNIKNHFINFNVQECHVNKLFGNKIWQACRYSNSYLEKIDSTARPTFQLMDKWILSRLSNLVKVVGESLHNYEVHIATSAIKNFLYYEFCDIYLETTKRGLKVGDSGMAAGHCWALTKSLDVGLRVLAPFMPRLAQHLHQHLERFPGEDRTLDFPQELNWRDEGLEKRVETVMDLVVAIRRLKKIFNVTAKHNPEVHVITDLEFEDFQFPIEDLSACTRINFSRELAPDLKRKGVTDSLGDNLKIHLIVPEELKKALDLDAPKLDGQKKKIFKELEKMDKMMSGENYAIKATIESQEVHAKKVATLRGKLDRIHYIENLLKQ